MKLKFDVHFEGMDAIKDKLADSCTKAEHILAQQMAKDTSPYVPMLTGSLDERTRVEGSKIIYPGPYARYLYEGKVMVDAKTGKGPSHFTDKNGNEVVAFPKGSKLRATDRNLVFTTASHPDAQDHWFEASKAQNMDKWERVAQKAVEKGLDK